MRGAWIFPGYAPRQNAKDFGVVALCVARTTRNFHGFFDYGDPPLAGPKKRLNAVSLWGRMPSLVQDVVDGREFLIPIFSVRP